MARRRELQTILIALTGLATAASAVAGTFSISPIRVELSTQQRTEALTVRNEAADQVVVQAQAMEWTQRDGEDVLTETHDIIVTPPVFTMEGNAQQIVRVASRRSADAKRELAYRLILQEVQPEAPKKFAGLQVALRLVLPIFIAPQNKGTAQLAWSSAWQSDGALQILAVNQGDLHSQVIDFTVQAKNSTAQLRNSVVKYVLPGATMKWTLQPPTDRELANQLKQNVLVLHGASDQGELTAELPAVNK